MLGGVNWLLARIASTSARCGLLLWHVACMSVCLSVFDRRLRVGHDHDREPYKNGSTDRDSVNWELELDSQRPHIILAPPGKYN